MKIHEDQYKEKIVPSHEIDIRLKKLKGEMEKDRKLKGGVEVLSLVMSKGQPKTPFHAKPKGRMRSPKTED